MKSHLSTAQKLWLQTHNLLWFQRDQMEYSNSQGKMQQHTLDIKSELEFLEDLRNAIDEGCGCSEFQCSRCKLINKKIALGRQLQKEVMIKKFDDIAFSLEHENDIQIRNRIKKIFRELEDNSPHSSRLSAQAHGIGGSTPSEDINSPQTKPDSVKTDNSRSNVADEQRENTAWRDKSVDTNFIQTEYENGFFEAGRFAKEREVLEINQKVRQIVEKEHGSPNAYIDMYSELMHEQISEGTI